MTKSPKHDRPSGNPTLWTVAALRWALKSPEHELAIGQEIETVEVPDRELAVAIAHHLLDKHAHDGEVWADVSGIVPGYDGTFAIEFTPWGEWLPAAVVRSKNTSGLSETELAAYILRKMTWISDDPEAISKRLAEIVGRVESLKDELDA